MRRQGFGSGGSVLAESGLGSRALRPPRFFILLLVVGCASIFFPGLARAQTGTVVFGQSAYTNSVSQGSAPITIIFSGSTDATASVTFSTSDGSAKAGTDYVAVSTSVNFPVQVTTNAAGSVTNTVPITLLNNGVPGSTQTVNLALSNPLGPAVLGSPSTAVLTIINNESQQLQFEFATYSVDDSNDVAVITVIRTNGTNGTVAVDFATSDGSAKAGVDYTATNGTVAFADGVLTKTFEIPIISPPFGALETNRTVTLTLSNPSGGAVLGTNVHAQLTIVATVRKSLS